MAAINRACPLDSADLPAQDGDVQSHTQQAHEASMPKALSNDPEGHGNIWQRFEELEKTAAVLSVSNMQLIGEKLRIASVRASQAYADQ